MLALALTFWSAMGATALMTHQVFDGIPDRSHLNRVTQMARASVFFDRHNQPAFTISREQRLEVPLEQVSPHLQRAIIAIEDQRFHKHRGVDLFRIAGAAVANLREGRTAQGASTITQQLARMSFLTPDKTYTRKVQEAVVAGLLESDYSKDHILELYLNKVYFGSGLYGAEAAALGYFGKHAADLDVAEAALLAGLVKAPSSYAPTTDLDRAVSRRAVVLDQMREMGVIDEPTLKQAKAAKVVLIDALRREEPYGRFFKEHVKRELIARFGEERVYEGGLKVYTTIDVDMQRAADAEVQRVLIELDKRRAQARPHQSGDPAGCAAGSGSAHRRSARDDWRPRFHSEQLQPRDPRAPAGGFCLQALRLRGGARGGVQSGVAHHRSRPPHQHAAGCVGARGRPLFSGRNDDARGAEDFEQSRSGANDRKRRHWQGGKLR